MKAGIHPVYKTIKFKCVCGAIIETRSAIESGPAGDGYHHLEICASCHPFFTGKQKLMDKAGRVERFRRRYEKPEETAERAKKAVAAEDAERAEKADKAETPQS